MVVDLISHNEWKTKWLFMSGLSVVSKFVYQTYGAAMPVCWVSLHWLSFLNTNCCSTFGTAFSQRFCQRTASVPSLPLPYRREATPRWCFFAELQGGVACLNSHFCSHEIKGAGLMEIIPWALLGELDNLPPKSTKQTPPN